MNENKELVNFPPGTTVKHEKGVILIPTAPVEMKFETVSNIFVTENALQEESTSKNIAVGESNEYTPGTSIVMRGKATYLFEEL